MNKKIIFISVGGIAIVIGLITYFLMPSTLKLSKASNYKQIGSTETNLQSTNLASAYFTDKDTFNNSSVGKINTYSVNNASGTAILIPQTHKYPGSSANDAVNDSAEVAQNQIFNILSDLHDKDNIKLIMAEGDLYGEVSSTKISTLQNKISLLDSFSQEISDLGSSSSPVTNLVSKSAKEFISSINREITLAGAAYKLKAQDSDIILYGSENASTLEKCADIVRTLTYLQDRLTQLNGTAGNQVSSARSISGNTLDISSLIGKTSPSNSLDYIFNIASKLASLSGSNSNKITEAATTYQKIKAVEKAEGIKTSENNNSPSRSDNPYRNINDAKTIQDKINETNSEINSVVIGQRNGEAAENFSRALSETNQKIGIITFGSGHEDGLVKELNKKGLSVVVISPKEVASSGLSK